MLPIEKQVEQKRSEWLSKNAESARYFMFEYKRSVFDKGLIVKVDSKDGSYEILKGLKDNPTQ